MQVPESAPVGAPMSVADAGTAKPTTSANDGAEVADGPAVAHAPVAAALGAGPVRWLLPSAVVMAALAAGALVLAYSTQQRVELLEAELTKRQQESAKAAYESLALARQGEGAAREAVAKVALLEARVAETAMQRSQFEDLLQSLARSRDENVLADVEAAVRVAQQQSAITGSAEPLILVLRQSEERLARYAQPRLERVRRAVAQDLERTRAAGVADLPALTIRLDELVRQVDELPMLATPAHRMPVRAAAGVAGAAPGSPALTAAAPASAAAPAPPLVRPAGPANAASVANAAAESAARTASASASASAAGASAGVGIGVWGTFQQSWARLTTQVLDETRSLLRVTRIDHPEAMLVAPEQAYFLRENLKLRLLNARLALLSRQFEIAQSDLRESLAALERYFDRNARRTVQVADGLRQVMAQARVVSLPRPDATLAAIAAASAGR